MCNLEFFNRVLPLFTVLCFGFFAFVIHAQSSVKLVAITSMGRFFQHESPHGAERVDIAAARNEVESFQVLVGADDTSITVKNVVFDKLTHTSGATISQENITLFRVEYTRVRKSTKKAELPPGLYPDALIPFINPITGKPIEPLKQTRQRWGEPRITTGYEMFAVPFEVYKGFNQPLWVDIKVPVDAPPGPYKGKLTVVTDQGKQAIEVNLVVWNFALPDKASHSNHFGTFKKLCNRFGLKQSSDEYKPIELRYCKLLADHRINPPVPDYMLPKVNPDGSLEITPEQHTALTRFMEEMKIVNFRIPRSPYGQLPRSTLREDYKTIAPDEREKAIRYYQEYARYIKENGWLEGAYLYLLDEPNTRENYEQVLVAAELVRAAAPEIRCLVVEQTYPQNPDWPDIDPAVDIWCPLWGFINRATVEEKLKQGDTVWSYTARVQNPRSYHPNYDKLRGKDPPYWQIDFALLAYRVPTWINYQYGITGLLYFSTIASGIDSWYNPAPRDNAGQHLNGNGHLTYPGTPCGIAGPIASMRLKNIRDGLEDYEYLVLLEKLGKKELAREAVNKVAPNWYDFARNPADILRVRQEIATAIEAALTAQ